MARAGHDRRRRAAAAGPALREAHAERRPLVVLADVPLFVVLMGGVALLMLLPAAHGLATARPGEAGVFLGSAGLLALLTFLLALATQRPGSAGRARGRLLSLLGAFVVLPVFLAVPLQAAATGVSFADAWFEMISALTTTGATLFAPEALSPTLHLWRATAGWAGGFLMWVAAIAVLAPMNLGGYEVLSSAPAGAPDRSDRPGRRREFRVRRHARRLAPIYGGLTGVLWLGLVILGEGPTVAACHAMSIIATSGISPLGGLDAARPPGSDGAAGAGLPGEALMLVFLVFALTRATFSREAGATRLERLRRDPELSLGLALVLGVTGLLFLRHWLGAWEFERVWDLSATLAALWGALFTTFSFLTTTGFVSAEWDVATSWSGLETPGLVLLGLALIGGGVATTAGGVKLLRAYALYKHGAREMSALVHPSSVGGAGPQARRLRREGAYIAWIFFMLFALSVAVVVCLLAAAGVPFDAAQVLTVAALSNTGPLAGVVLDAPISYAVLPGAAKAVFAASMVLGRLETLAIIALLNPAFWRR